jgi:CRISPR-associated protein Cas1
MREAIDLAFLRLDGRYQGRLESAEPRNVFLRKRQFMLVDDLVSRVRLTRDILSGKLANMATLMARIGRTRKSGEAKEASRAIRELARGLDDAASLDSLRGIEGAASAKYFQALKCGLEHDIGFRKRVRRPPTDPVNAVLSFLYTLLINRMYAAVRTSGLDPQPGVLHDLEYSRYSLPLDLVEEFRAPVADALTLALFNMNVLGREDFRTMRPETGMENATVVDAVDRAANDPLGSPRMPDTQEFFDLPEQPETCPEQERGAWPVLLKPEALRKVITAFEKKMGKDFHHPAAERYLTYAQAMEFQARQFRRAVEGEIERYQPLLLR